VELTKQTQRKKKSVGSKILHRERKYDRYKKLWREKGRKKSSF
jgi:hypothetical protein